MIKIKTLLGFLIKAGILCGLIGVLTVVGGYFYLKPQLPDVDQLRDIQLQTPLRIYSADQKLIAEYGEMRRTPVSFAQIPEAFVQAILSAEDGRFYSPGSVPADQYRSDPDRWQYHYHAGRPELFVDPRANFSA